ncbi:MAG TPA: cation:proton antiporter [Chloroflexota bacterium]|nr:cation:proton antiporter [Chloroflexota bacterium]
MLGPLALLLALGGLSYIVAARVVLVPGPLVALALGAVVGVGSPLGANLLWPGEQVLPPEPLLSFRAMGAVLLMWGAGVELEVAALRPGRQLFRAMAVGLGGAACSALLALGLLRLGLLGAFAPREQLGLALLSAASAIPVLLAVVRSLGRLHHPLTRTALVAALLVDLVLIALIPLINAEHAEVSPLAHLAKTLVYLGAMIALAEGPAREHLRRWGRAARRHVSRQSALIALGFGITLGVVSLAGQLGVELLPAALGWGIGSRPLFFPDAAEEHNPFFEAFFPFEASYFALAGAMLDLRLVSWEGALFAGAAIVGKVAGGLLGGRDGLRVGTLLVPRGAVDLVLAVNLLVNGVLSPAGYALAVTMIAITTLGGALLARLAFEGALSKPSAELERLRVTR